MIKLLVLAEALIKFTLPLDAHIEREVRVDVVVVDMPHDLYVRRFRDVRLGHINLATKVS